MVTLRSDNIIHHKVGVNLDASPTNYQVYLSTDGNNSQDNPYQKWTTQDMRDGTYRIIHTRSNLALDANYNREVYLSRHENNNNNNPYQRWRFVLLSDTYKIIHNQTGLSLDANYNREVYLSRHENNNEDNPYQRWCCTPIERERERSLTVMNPYIMLGLVNQERRNQNIPPVELDQRLMDVIQFQVDYCADNNILSHSNPAGDLGTRFRNFNYRYRSSAENLAYGHGVNEEVQVMRSWMNSPGHRTNILNRSHKHMGVGFKNSYWGQAFGSL